jgi:hypothetical protein
MAADGFKVLITFEKKDVEPFRILRLSRAHLTIKPVHKIDKSETVLF